MATLRKSIKITDKDLVDMLLNLKEEDVTSSFIYDLFGEFEGKAKANPYDLIDIPPGSYGPEKKKNKNSFTTTVGLWIFNKWFVEKELFDVFGYITSSVTGKLLDDMNQKLSYYLMEDLITTQQLKNFLIKTQLVMPYVTVLSPNHTEKILTCTKAISKKKNELFKKYAKEIEAGDAYIAELIEKELLDFAKEYIGDDPSLDTFLSGARGSFGNNFKNMYVMKGAIRNSDPYAKKEYEISKSNYMDGITKEEYAIYCNAAVAGPYSRGKKTEYGGELENLFTKCYQDVVLDEDGTDCKTDRHIVVELTESNFKRYVYNYIISSSGNLVELTYQNKDKYIGKKVKMRFAMLCKNPKICSKCAGAFLHKLGIKNVGMTLMQVPSIFKNVAMKAFHDSTIKSTEMDCMKAFGIE